MTYLFPIIATLVLSISGFLYFMPSQTSDSVLSEVPVGADTRVFISSQLAPNPQDGYILSTTGTSSEWIPDTGGGGSSKWTDATTYIYPTGGLYASAPYFVGTSTSLYSTFYNASTTNFSSTYATSTNLGTSDVRAIGSGGMSFFSSNGTQVASFGAGGGSNVTFSGGVNIDGTTRLATSLTGLALTTSGSVSAYSGTSCTNQFVRSLNASGVATCATVANTDLANSSVSYGGVSVSLGGSDATPAFNLVDATGLPISTGVSGLGTGVSTFLGTPSSANLATALTDETGTAGSVVFSISPTLTGLLSFANASGTALTLSGNGYVGGNLGVGTTAPPSKLAIQDTNAWSVVKGSLSVTDSGTIGAGLSLTSNGTGGRDYAIISTANSAGSGGGRLGFYDVASNAYRMVINSDGRVGIGNVAPGSNLTIGSASSVATNTPTDINLGGTYSSAAGSNLKLKLYNDGSVIYGLGVSANSMDFTSGASGGMNFYTNNTTSTPRMTITSAGTVSIAGLLDVGSGSLEIPNGASPTVDATGELALNTTLNSLSYATSTTGGELPLYPPFRFTIASSSWTGTSTEIGYPTTPNFDELVTTGICYANGSGRIIVGNGISTTTPVTLSVGTTTVAVNRRFNKNGTMIRYHVGTPTTLSQVQCSFERVYLR